MLFMFILVSCFLGAILSLMGPLGIIIGFGIVVGILFRALYLITDIQKRLSKVTQKPDKVKDALEDYLNERKNLESHKDDKAKFEQQAE